MAGVKQRRPGQAEAPAAGTHAVLMAMLRELHAISHLLDQRDDVADFNPSAIGVTDDPRGLLEQRDWPIHGGRRWLLGQRRGYGKTVAIGGGSVTDLLPTNAARLGGVISLDSQATAVLTVWLADANTVNSGIQAIPRLFVAPGARWDLKLSDLVWCGSISASLPAAAFNVAVAEL